MNITKVIICILAMAPLLFSYDGNSGEVEEREELRSQCTIEVFDGDVSSATVGFAGAGENSSLTVSIPQRAVIDEATLDIEGRGVSGSTNVAIINYSDTVNNKAWDFFNNKEYPITSAPSAFKNSPFSAP